METFRNVKVGQTFKTSNGQPSRKISDSKAISLVPHYTGFDFQDSVNDVEFKCNDTDSVYDIGDTSNKGWRV